MGRARHPHLFQLVELAHFGAEDVDDHVAGESISTQSPVSLPSILARMRNCSFSRSASFSEIARHLTR